jgi:hypothetical protein
MVGGKTPHIIVKVGGAENVIDVLTTTGTARLTQETLRKLWTAVRDYIHNIKTCTHLWTAVRD